MPSTDSSRTIHFDIISLFPEMFEGPFQESILDRAREEGLLDVRLHNLRDYTLNKHGKVDDTPFGGGAGLVMNIEPIDRALQAIKQDRPQALTVLLSPSGKRFDQKKARELADSNQIILICGRYEGVDERVAETLVDEQLSIGDYVLSGGEIPAMVLVDAVTRLIPGVVGDPASLDEESFENGLLEYPQYTRPRDYKGSEVPEVLVSGDHKKIKEWQRKAALKKTARHRPDLLEQLNLNNEERAMIDETNNE
ncbi:MAG: tRNA (guanosine(37)-N1)-methyltransferase TrmD [Candidatus Nitronauta litoralis]|uniref:tRNA (guanine-N(1)-)-methyltransferase n=1 Tax=Candidatus Nitronauta litoralis TaxID=2705533 RepID=A0A7T0BWS5_9BACT|nr:MAG: tRNA (guanosine(37)-N1)-methyltransferase TrmD [Candidatus Nitronauta litoralis]